MPIRKRGDSKNRRANRSGDSKGLIRKTSTQLDTKQTSYQAPSVVNAEQVSTVVNALASVGKLCEVLVSPKMAEVAKTALQVTTVRDVLSQIVGRDGIDARRFKVDATNIAHLVDTVMEKYQEKISSNYTTDMLDAEEEQGYAGKNKRPF